VATRTPSGASGALTAGLLLYSGLAQPLGPSLGGAQGGAVSAGAALGAGGATAFTAQQIARLLRHGRAMLDNPHVRAYVLGLAGCLSQVPPRLRAVLRLRVGVQEPRRLDARATAKRLHVSRRRLRAMEVQALRELSEAARATGCATRAVTQAENGPRFVPVAFMGGLGQGAAGGVAGGLYFREPAEAGAEPQTPGEVIPAPALHHAESDDAPLFWALAAAFGGALLIAYLIRSDMGLGPPVLLRRRRPGRGGAGRRRRPREH